MNTRTPVSRNASAHRASHRPSVIAACAQHDLAAQFIAVFRDNTDCDLQVLATGDAVLRASSCDLLLVDADLPVLSGFELCDLLKRNQDTSEIPIIILEFRAVSEYRKAKALELGAVAYANAMSATAAVVSRVAAFLPLGPPLNVASSVKPAKYLGKHLVVDFSREKVTVDAQPVVLKRREFEILQYLITYRDRVVRREQLRRDLWGKKEVSDRTVDVHICRLRELLGPAGAQIETRHHFGHRFVHLPRQ